MDNDLREETDSDVSAEFFNKQGSGAKHAVLVDNQTSNMFERTIESAADAPSDELCPHIDDGHDDEASEIYTKGQFVNEGFGKRPRRGDLFLQKVQ